MAIFEGFFNPFLGAASAIISAGSRITKSGPVRATRTGITPELSGLPFQLTFTPPGTSAPTQTFVPVGGGGGIAYGTEVPPQLRDKFLAAVLAPRAIRDEIFRGGGGRAGAGPRPRGSTPTPAERRAMQKKVEQIGKPTPNVPARVDKPMQGPPAPKTPKRPTLEEFGQDIAGGAAVIGSIILGGLSQITIGPPRPVPPAPGDIGPFPPKDPSTIGPFPADEDRETLEEITVNAQRRSLPASTRATPPGVLGPNVPPPAPAPAPAPPVATPSPVLAAIVRAAPLLGAAALVSPQVRAQTQITAVNPPAPNLAPQPQPQAFGPPALTPTQTKQDTCERKGRKNRKTCWEGFYREYPNSTKYTKWTKVDCKTRKIIEEK